MSRKEEIRKHNLEIIEAINSVLQDRKDVESFDYDYTEDMYGDEDDEDYGMFFDVEYEVNFSFSDRVRSFAISRGFSGLILHIGDIQFELGLVDDDIELLYSGSVELIQTLVRCMM